MAALVSSKLVLASLLKNFSLHGCSKNLSLCPPSSGIGGRQQMISNIKWFSTEAKPLGQDLPKQLDVFKDLGMFKLAHKKVENLGLGGGLLVDYDLTTKDDKRLFLIEHFYGRTSPYFYVKIKTKIEDVRPLVEMKLIRNIKNDIFGLKYFGAENTKFLGTMEVFKNNKREYVLKNPKEKVLLHLVSDGDYGWATKVRIYEPDLTKIVGKMSKTQEIYLRSKLNAKIQFPASLELLAKVQLIGATIYLMSQHEHD